MTEQFTKRELQQIMVILNSWGDVTPEDCLLRQKVEKMIAEFPKSTEEVIGGIPCTVERGAE
jgi:hypothetical protein